jgi:hypothetical protein
MLATMSHMDASEVVATALDDLKRACVSVEDALTADEDLDRDKEGLSLSALADRWGMSKARAAQLVKLPKETGSGDSRPSG